MRPVLSMSKEVEKSSRCSAKDSSTPTASPPPLEMTELRIAARRLFGEELPVLLEELNEVLVA